MKVRARRVWFSWLKGLAAAVGIVALVVPVLGQPTGATPRPKIGLALAGGSALGLSHIGVIEWLEAHRIPVDYIAGTSMGGLVSGAYATGMTPVEMRAMLKGIPWGEALADEASYQILDFRRREDRRAVPAHIEMGVRHGPRMRVGISPAAPVGLLLSRISLGHSDLESFDDLPIPFRCMAVDMATGEALTLKDGSLATALRATMSIPAFFTPVERNGKLLTDGGTLNNLPTEALKAMGADVILAVNLHAVLTDVKELHTLVDLLGQTTAIAIKANEQRSLALADIVITPDLTGLAGAEFHRVDDFATRGYQAAERRAAVLSRLSLPAEEWEAHLVQRRSKRRREPFAPEFVRVEGAGERETEALEKRFQPFLGAPVSPDRLESELTSLTGGGLFDSFVYGKAREGERNGLLIGANRRRHGPPFLRLGMEVNGAESDNIQFSFLSRLTALDVGAPGAEVRADLRLGTNSLIRGEYYRPLGLSRWFVAPRLFREEERTNVYQNRARVATYRVRSPGAGMDIGYRTGRDSELRLGYEWRDLKASVSTGDPLLPSLSGPSSAAVLRWQYEGFDNPWVPTSGTRLSLHSQYFFEAPEADGDFPWLEFRGTHFHPLSPRASLFGHVSAGTTFGSDAPPVQQFTLGGPLRLGAYGLDEFRGSHSLLFAAGYMQHLFQLPPFLGRSVRLGAWLETGGIFTEFGKGKYEQDLSLALFADTMLGPLVLGGSVADAGRSEFYFAIGSLF